MNTLFSGEWQWFSEHIQSGIVLALHTLIMIGVSLRVIMKRRPIGISLAWLTLTYAIPFVGFGLYLLFGEIRLGRRRALLARAMYSPYANWVRRQSRRAKDLCGGASHKAEPLHDLIKSRLAMPMISGNRMALLDDPLAILTNLAEKIHQAKEFCYLEFYIWQCGGEVDLVGDALIAAAKRGIDCRLLLDSVGSAHFFRSRWPARLQDAGVKLVEVLPVGAWRIPFQRQDLRMHRKLILIDQRAYTGSMNLVDPRYFKQGSGVGQWIDIMVEIEGPMVPLIWSLFVRDWEMETGERLLSLITHKPQCWEQPDIRCQLIPSGPFSGGDAMAQILLQAIYQAKERLILTTPYFVPDDPLIEALRSAAERGVTVELILPARNDSRLAHYASNAFMEELLSAGVNVYRFHAGLLHTKAVLVDNDFALIGSLNLDKRSFWLNFEVTLLIDHPEFTDELHILIEQYKQSSHAMELRSWRRRPWHQRLRENLCYLVSPLL